MLWLQALGGLRALVGLALGGLRGAAGGALARPVAPLATIMAGASVTLINISCIADYDNYILSHTFTSDTNYS